MLPENEILMEGETVVGRYQALIARWANGEWSTTIPAIYLLVTDQRLIMQPQSRKKYQPASIPGRYIRAVSTLDAHRQGLSLTLKDNQKINLFISWGQDFNLVEFIHEMAALPNNRAYHLPLSIDYLQKLIGFVETM